MSPRLTRTLLAAGLLSALTLTLNGCGGADTDSGTGTDDADDYAEAIPDSESLALEMDDGDEPATGEDGALTGRPSELRRLARDVFEKVNALREQAHARIEALKANSEPEAFTEGKFECKRWLTDDAEAGVHWRLTSCRKDKKNRHYAFALKGRALDAGDDALVPVMAGEGKVLARFDGKKRGHGKVGFDFDALAELTGAEGDDAPQGKLGIGFRAAGKVRQLNVGLKDFARAGDETPVTGLYRYKHIHKVGGKVALIAHGDVVTRDEGGGLVQGEDGLEELVRAAVIWNRGIGARTVAAVCGGTVGENTCERVVQCWKRDGVVSHESVDGEAEATGNGRGRGHSKPKFEPAMCPGAAAGIDDLEDAPGAEDFEVPAGEALPDEPQADPSEG